MKTRISHIINWLTGLRKSTWVIIMLLMGGAIFFWKILPGRLFYDPTSYVLEDTEGSLLNATIAEDGQWRFPYSSRLPQKFIDCIITFEDKRFYYHPGIDMAAITRALSANAKKNTSRQGGSTITMQVIRLAKKNNKRTVWNKIKESALALRLEFSYSKREILSLYASNAPFGSNVVGLDAAAWRYYGRSPETLSWGEMATLAVLPNSPSLIHPGKNRDILLEKRNRLLDKLVLAGKINSSDCALAKTEPLPEKPIPLPQLAPHLLQRFKKENKNIRATKLQTTINSKLQQDVSRILLQHHMQLKGNGINNIAALVIDVKTGNALAYVGNIYKQADTEIQGDVDIINSRRSPGSVLKPVLYAAMLSDGMILPNSLVADIPTNISGYTPQNYNREYDGAVPADKALARSLNIPAVKLLQQFKYARFYEILQQCGINTLNNPADFYGLSLVLGGCEVNMWQLAGMYASLARSLNNEEKNNGEIRSSDFHDPRFDPKKKFNTKNKNIRLDPVSVYYTFQAMQEVMRPGEEGLWQQFTSSQKIAWKTGTSFGFRDGWSIGVTPQYVVAVWAGNADGEGRPGLIGINTAAPAMFDIFRLLPAGKWFKKPGNNFSHISVCRRSGFRSNLDCPETDTLFMPPNAGRSPLCNYHRLIHIDNAGLQVTENCASPADMKHTSWFVLPPAMEYYYKQRNYDYKLLPAYKEGCKASETAKQMEIIYPQPDSKIYVPIEISGQKGKVIFTAAHRKKKAKIFWALDNEFLTTTVDDLHQVSLSPPAGDHIITLTDEDGTSLSRSFRILDKEAGVN